MASARLKQEVFAVDGIIRDFARNHPDEVPNTPSSRFPELTASNVNVQECISSNAASLTELLHDRCVRNASSRRPSLPFWPPPPPLPFPSLPQTTLPPSVLAVLPRLPPRGAGLSCPAPLHRDRVPEAGNPYTRGRSSRTQPSGKGGIARVPCGSCYPFTGRGWHPHQVCQHADH